MTINATTPRTMDGTTRADRHDAYGIYRTDITIDAGTNGITVAQLCAALGQLDAGATVSFAIPRTDGSSIELTTVSWLRAFNGTVFVTADGDTWDALTADLM